MNYPMHGTHYYSRQPSLAVETGVNVPRMLPLRNEYSVDWQRSPSGADRATQGQFQYERNRTVENQFPTRTSFSDLSERNSMDSAYHSRRNSSLDFGDQSGHVNNHSILDLDARGQGYGKFPAAAKIQPQMSLLNESAMHSESASSRSARGTFDEAATRNLQPGKERVSSSATMSVAENFPTSPAYGSHSPNRNEVSPEHFALSQPLRAKSFSCDRSGAQLSTSSVQFKNRNSTAFVGVGFPNTSGTQVQPFYNTATPNDLENELSRTANERWISDRHEDFRPSGVHPQYNGKRVADLSPSMIGRSSGMDQSQGTNFGATDMTRKNFALTSDQQFVSAGQESSPRDSTTGSPGSLKGQPPSQTSLIRQLSKELYGRSSLSVINRLIATGDKHPRLGSIDENSPGYERSSYESRLGLNSRRKSSSELDRLSKGFHYNDEAESGNVNQTDCSFSPEISGNTESSDLADRSVVLDEDEIGDGSNFVRNRKCQMSLRKAFGIFDEFSVAEQSSRDVRQLPTSNLTNKKDVKTSHGDPNNLCDVQDSICTRNSEDVVKLRKADIDHHPILKKSSQHLESQRKYSEDGLLSFRADDHSNHQDPDLSTRLFSEPSWRVRSVDLGAIALRHEIEVPSYFQPEVAAAARKKSVSLPRQGTMPFQVRDGGSTSLSFEQPGINAIYTGTGLSSATNESPRNHYYSNGKQLWAKASEDQDSTGQCKRDKARSTTARCGGRSSSSSEEISPMPVIYTADDAFLGVENLASGSVSPTPPTLPPRQYRNSSSADDGQESNHSVQKSNTGMDLFVSNDNDDDLDSTLKRDSYAYILRQQARRHSQSAVASLNQRRRPPPPCSEPKATLASYDGCDSAWENRRPSYAADKTAVHMETDVIRVLKPNQSPNLTDTADVECNASGKSNRKASGQCMSESSYVARTVPSAMNSENSNEFRSRTAVGSDKTSQSDAQRLSKMTDAKGSRCLGSSRTSSQVIDSRVISSEAGVRADADGQCVTSADIGDVVPCAEISNHFSHKMESFRIVEDSADDSEKPDNGKRIQKSCIQDLPRTDAVNVETDVVVPSTKIPEIASKKDVSQRPAIAPKRIVLPIKTAKIKGSPRPNKSSEEVSRTCQATVATANQVTTASLAPQPKTAADYMTGLFTEDGHDSVVQSDTLTRNSVQRASLRNRLLLGRQAKESKTKSNSILLEEGQTPDGLCEIPLGLRSSGDVTTATSEEEKAELVKTLEKKLEVLKEERLLLIEEIRENNCLGDLVTQIVEKRLERRELSKYSSFVVELEKVLYLLLKLAERLAKQENAILALPQNASDKEKASLISKRNDLKEKYGDALSIKDDIDRRREQVASYLQKCLSEDELKDYEYFIKMKAQLVIDRQEVEDKLDVGERRLEVLKSTMVNESRSEPDD